MKKLAAYCRVSTDRQRDEQTIDVQKTFIAEWASKDDLVILEWYLDDGWSGELLARPELDRLRDDIKKGLFEGVVFIDRDRLARKLSLQELIIDELTDKNIEVIFLNEPLAQNPEGRIMQQIKGVFAEYERAKITERMRRGKMHKAKSGKIVGNEAPYGYRYVLKVGDQDGYYVVNEPEAEIVRMIFHWVADDGYSMYRVIQELYTKDIPPPKKKSERWRKSAIERLLHRHDYIGTMFYNKAGSVVPKNPQTVGIYKKIKKSSRKAKPKDEWIAISVPPILDNEEIFYRAHDQLKKSVILNPRNKKYPYMLTGKVFCSCGSKRVGDGIKGHHYYRCAQRIYQFPLPNKCTSQGVNAEILDEMVWNKLVTMLSEPDLIKAQVLRWQKKQDKSSVIPTDSLTHAKQALLVLSEEEDRYTKAFGSELITFEKFKDLMAELKAKRAAIESQAKEILLNTQANYAPIGDIDRVCADVLLELKSATQITKQKYLQNLIQSIYVKERSSATVNGSIPYTVQAQNIQDEPKRRYCRFAKCREEYPF